MEIRFKDNTKKYILFIYIFKGRKDANSKDSRQLFLIHVLDYFVFRMRLEL